MLDNLANTFIMTYHSNHKPRKDQTFHVTDSKEGMSEVMEGIVLDLSLLQLHKIILLFGIMGINKQWNMF